MARTKDFEENEVLKKAILLFSYQGYAATSMQDVVDALGLSRSSIYDTFGSKHQLYLSALNYYQDENTEQLHQLISNSVSKKEAIKTLLVTLVEGWLNDEQRKGCFMTNAKMELAQHDPAVKEMVNRFEQHTENVLVQLITEGQNSGEISKRQPALLLARFIENTIKGLQVAVKSANTPEFLEQVIQVSLTVLD